MLQSERENDDHCLTCKPGYMVVGKTCSSWGCSVADVGCKFCLPEAQRRSEQSCAECHAGYRLPMNKKLNITDPSTMVCKKLGCSSKCGDCVGLHWRIREEDCQSCPAGMTLVEKDIPSFAKDCSGAKAEFFEHDHKIFGLEVGTAVGITYKNAPHCVFSWAGDLHGWKAWTGNDRRKAVLTDLSGTKVEAGDTSWENVAFPAKWTKTGTTANYQVINFKKTAQTCKNFKCDKGPSGSKCRTCRAQKARTSDHSCVACWAGHRLIAGKCLAWRCYAGPGTGCKTCVEQKLRKSNEDCGTCNPGYHAVGKRCVPYTCKTVAEGNKEPNTSEVFTPRPITPTCWLYKRDAPTLTLRLWLHGVRRDVSR